MKKIAVVILGLALLVTVVPVMAKAETHEVTAAMTASTGTFSGIKLNDGSIFFYDMVGAANVTLDITNYGSVPDYKFAVTNVLNGTINTKTNEGVMHYKTVWRYQSAGQIVGTFEGEMKGKSTTYRYINGIPLPMYSDNVFHCVLQGDGVFKGWTLKLEGLRPTQTFPPLNLTGKPSTYWGTLLIP